ncbi:uncharacterized protein BKA78DRAFT_294150 [Phyllosticta capitalensis]|uniref:Uncharacterized protein n=1 Tax=Phyllosticta capitalensis TaxID=121624 RepID=A0ABR1YSL4_9PEZI
MNLTVLAHEETGMEWCKDTGRILCNVPEKDDDESVWMIRNSRPGNNTFNTIYYNTPDEKERAPKDPLKGKTLVPYLRSLKLKFDRPVDVILSNAKIKNVWAKIFKQEPEDLTRLAQSKSAAPADTKSAPGQSSTKPSNTGAQPSNTGAQPSTTASTTASTANDDGVVTPREPLYLAYINKHCGNVHSRFYQRISDAFQEKFGRVMSTDLTRMLCREMMAGKRDNYQNTLVFLRWNGGKLPDYPTLVEKAALQKEREKQGYGSWAWVLDRGQASD